ncbi:MAG: 50S ribosomal protein L9 [Myxococcota bacterium]
MEIILTEDMPKLGQAGEIVRVKNGYARNYLLPRGKAMLATRGRVKELEHQKRVVEEKQRKEIGAHEAVAKHIRTLTLEFQARAGEEGRLFGSVTNSDIAQKLLEKGVEVDRRKIEIQEPIRQVGDYTVPVRLHRKVVAEVAVTVTALEAQESTELTKAQVE